jgi:small-conductance mechanosensitive channel
VALNFDLGPLGEFIDRVAGEATPAQWLWQAGVAVAALVLGWSVAHLICRRLKPGPRWRFGKGDFERVAFPLVTLIFVALGRLILGRFQPVIALEIMQSLLVASLIIRVAVYILGHILPEGNFLRTVVRLIAWVTWIGVALHLTGLLPEVISALDDIGFTAGKNHQRVTVWLALQAIAALGLTLAVALWLGRITETRVLAAQSVEMSTRIVVTKIVRVSSILIAILVALPLVGIDVTALSVFSGALGVGLGFGLQKIASNYVSGFIVLLDRSLRIGDVVTVDGRKGEVKAIESRYTVIKGGDGVESIVPNETLITQSVNHHTYSDPRVSVVIAVSISYESDVERACELLLEIARRQARVIADPPAAARLKELGEHGIAMELTVWISDPAVGEGELRSALLKDILRTFKANRVEIPYPRRDVRLIATPETSEKPIPSST